MLHIKQYPWHSDRFRVTLLLPGSSRAAPGVDSLSISITWNMSWDIGGPHCMLPSEGISKFVQDLLGARP